MVLRELLARASTKRVAPMESPPVPWPARVAMVSMHTSPLAQPGAADAGGLNVYVAQTALHLARRGVTLELFTRASSAADRPIVEVAPGLRVHHVIAGPPDHVAKQDLPSLVQAMAAAITARAEHLDPPDLIHSHYWLSGEVGLRLRCAWGVPLVHSMHTLGARKNESIPPGDDKEPNLRLAGERRIATAADLLVANTEAERRDLIEHCGASSQRIAVVPPGVDLDRLHPGGRDDARARFDLAPGTPMVGFVGRLQRLKGPDVLLDAMGALREVDPELAARTRVIISGGPSGADAGYAGSLRRQARAQGVDATFLPPLDATMLRCLYVAADLIAMPSHSETFGLVALEAQACGTPVVATDVGGLRIAVADGRSGTLVAGHDPHAWADAIRDLLTDPQRRRALRAGALAHARTLSWDGTVDGLMAGYAAVGALRTAGPPRESASRAQSWGG